jgi:hypothetical protein
VKKAIIAAAYFAFILALTGCSSFSLPEFGGRTDSGSTTIRDNPQVGGGSSGTGSSGASTGPSSAINGSRVEAIGPEVNRNDPAKTDAELIAEAIRWGDCAFLYEYTQREDANRQLVTQANNAIRRYTQPDNTVGRYRTGRMEARIRRVPQNLMDQVFADPETALSGVVTSLISGVSDQFLKAKTIHDWICDNIAYDTGMFFSGRVSAQDYASVLKKKQAVCSGYANLFNEMARLAGIESIGINGYSKGFGYSGQIGRNTDHAWNAVYISNKWYLIDVTWDAGSVDQRTFIKGYSTEWLFLDPRPFLYSHLPEENAYQYYAPVLTTADFMREAYISGKFFQYGLSLKTEMPEYSNAANGPFAFDIGLANSNVMVTSNLTTPRQQEIDGASWTSRRSTTVTAEFDVPDAGEYTGHIFVRQNNEVRPQNMVAIAVFERDWLPRAEQLYTDTSLARDRRITEAEFNLFKGAYFKVQENGRYYLAEDQFDTPRNNAVLKVYQLLDISTISLESVLTFNIRAASGYRGFGVGVLKYPDTFGAYNQASNTQLLSPIKGVLQSGTTEQFSVSSSDYTRIAIIINGDLTNIPRNTRSGNYELAFEVPFGITGLQIYGSSDGRNYTGLISYTVE